MSWKIWFVELDDRGRIEIPAELRRRLGIGHGSELALVVHGHSVYLHPRCPDEPVSEGSSEPAF